MTNVKVNTDCFAKTAERRQQKKRCIEGWPCNRSLKNTKNVLYLDELFSYVLSNPQISITLITTPMELSFQMYSINVILQGFDIESKCFTLMANLETGILIALGKSFFLKKGTYSC